MVRSPNRRILPQKRASENFTISFAGEKYDVTTGFYPDGSPGEVFINRVRDKAAAKLGTQLDGVCRDGAVLLSLALQHGTPLTTILGAITINGEGEPETVIGEIVAMIASRCA